MSPSFDVFLCSAAADRPQAKALAEGARQAGLSVFFAADTLTPGDPWDEAIPAALERARMIVVLVTPRWQTPRWKDGPWYGPDEVARAIRRHRGGDGARIVPVLAGASSELVPYGLACLVPLVVESDAYAAAGRRLADVLAGLPAAPTVPEPPLDGVPLPLLRCLADNFPDTSHARAIWTRAGGAIREVENLARPLDLWQRLWQQSMHGAAARPDALLRAALDELPHNAILVRYLAAIERAT